jgi:hypothetical protein
MLSALPVILAVVIAGKALGLEVTLFCICREPAYFFHFHWAHDLEIPPRDLLFEFCYKSTEKYWRITQTYMDFKPAGCHIGNSFFRASCRGSFEKEKMKLLLPTMTSAMKTTTTTSASTIEP